MDSNQIRQYVTRYLLAFDSQFLDSGPGHLTVQLPVEVDKDLTNRPLYWSFVERTGQTPQTMTMCFIFDPDQCPENTAGEVLRMGSPRLAQIFSSAKKRGRWVRLFQEAGQLPSTGSRPLLPWLTLNLKVQFLCDQKRDLLFSLGMNLFSGEMGTHFLEHISRLNLSPRLPERHYTMAPNISLTEAAEHIRSWLLERLEEEDSTWAQAARLRLEEEMRILRSYFPPDAEEEARQRFEQRAQELRWQFEPRIEVQVTGAGVVYLLPDALTAAQ